MKKVFNLLIPLLVIALPFYVVRFNIGPIPTTLLEVAIISTFIVALLSGKLKKIKNFNAVFFGGIFVLLALIGVVSDPDKIRALGIWKAYFVDSYFVFLIVLSLSKKERSETLWYLIISGFIVSVVGLVMYFLGVKSPDGRLVDMDRLSPNYLAMYLTPIFLVSLSFSVWQDQPIFKKVFASLSSLLILFAIYLTQSRGAIIGLGLGLIVMFFSTFIKTKYEKVARVLLAAVIVGVLALSFWYFKPDWTDHSRKATSSNIRYYIWTTSLEIAKKNPLWGVGISNYQDYFTDLTKNRVNYPEYISPQALTAHNLYIHMYLSTGILGILAFLIFLTASKFWKLYSIPASVALIGILSYGLVDTPFFRNDLAALLLIILGLIYSAQNESKKS